MPPPLSCCRGAGVAGAGGGDAGCGNGAGADGGGGNSSGDAGGGNGGDGGGGAAGGGKGNGGWNVPEAAPSPVVVRGRMHLLVRARIVVRRPCPCLALALAFARRFDFVLVRKSAALRCCCGWLRVRKIRSTASRRFRYAAASPDSDSSLQAQVHFQMQPARVVALTRIELQPSTPHAISLQ